MERNRTHLVLGVIAVIGLVLFPYLAPRVLGSYEFRILRLILVSIVLGEALNLTTGLTGLMSLGHSGFVLVGAYMYALLATSWSVKLSAWVVRAPVWPLNGWPFQVALVAAVVVSSAFGFPIAYASLRFIGDYFSIATMAFSEIILLFALNLIPLTNGPLGIRGIPDDLNIVWLWWLAIASVVLVGSISRSAFGRALKCIKGDERTAEVLGVNVLHHKVIAFLVACAIDGLAGAMMASLYGNVDPSQFSYVAMYPTLMMVILGGLGSVTGTVLGAVAVTVFLEWARIFDTPATFFGLHFPGMPGLRVIIVAIFLVASMGFFRSGLMGTNELSWDTLSSGLARISRGVGALRGRLARRT